MKSAQLITVFSHYRKALFSAFLLTGLFCPRFIQAAQYTFTVHDYAVGTGPANLVSNGIPFKPGELTNAANVRILDGATELSIGTRVLARWPTDNSIRSLLVQFEAPFAAATKSFTMDVGPARTIADRALVPVTWRTPRKIATFSGVYLSASLIAWEQKPVGQSGFPEWEQKQVTYFSAINFEPDPAVTCSNDDQYYDSANTSYQMYARSGELAHLTNGRRWAVHHGRNQIYLSGPTIGHGKCPGGYVNNTRYTLVDSLVRDYMLWGDDESLRVAGLVVDNFYMPHDSLWYYKAPNSRGFWTEREAAFAQLGLVAYYEATGNTTYLDKLRTRVLSLRQMQADNGNRAWVHNLYDHDPGEECSESSYGSSSFMSGLLFESLIRYHKLTGDPLARDSILWAVDDLQARNIATGRGAGQGLIYLGCTEVYTDAMPDIDNLITHAFGYAYRLTNFTNPQYLNFGRSMFNLSVGAGFAGSHKHFNQNFRTSGHFAAYIDPSVPGLQPATVPTALRAPKILSGPTATPATVTGTSTQLSVSAEDDKGENQLVYVWTVTGPDGASSAFASNGLNASKQTTLTFNRAGSYRISLVVRDSDNASTPSETLAVLVEPVFQSLTITPAAMTVLPATSLHLRVQARDQFGEVFPSPANLTWSSSGGGQIDADGHFVSNGTEGTFTIQAAGGGQTGTATVVVSRQSPPTVSVTAPMSSRRFVLPASVILAAQAGDTDGSVSRVEFLVKGVSVGSATKGNGNTWTLAWSPSSPGQYGVTAVATDNAGAVTASAEVIFTVVLDSTLPPTPPRAGESVMGMVISKPGDRICPPENGSFTVYDLNGRKVATFQGCWDGGNVASGQYVIVGGGRQTVVVVVR